MNLKELINEIKKKPRKSRINQIEKELKKQYNDNMDLENNYLLGIFYGIIKEDKEQAKKYLNYLVERDYSSYSYPYIFMAREYQNNKVKSKKILKRGLEATNGNLTIVQELFLQSNPKGKYDLFVKYIKDKNEKNLQESFIVYIIEFLFNNKKYKELYDFATIDFEKIDNKGILPTIYLVIAISSYEIKEYDNAKIFLEKIENIYISKEIDMFINIFKSILAFQLGEDNYKEILEDIDYSEIKTTEYVNFDYGYPPITFNIDDIFIQLFNKLGNILLEDKQLCTKMKCLSIIFKYDSESMIEEEIPNMIKFIEKVSKKEKNKVVLKTLYFLYMENEDYYKAFNLILDNNPNSDDWISSIKFIYMEKFTEKQMEKINNKFSSIYFYNKKNFEEILKKFIFYYKRKEEYAELTELIEELAIQKDKKIPDYMLFDVAYAYDRQNNKEKAKIYYEKCIEKEEALAPAMNNLALIYEQNNDFDKAVNLLEEAFQLYTSEKGYSEEQIEKCKNNLKRCKKSQKNQMKLEKNMILAKNKITLEGYWYIEKLKQIYELQDESGFIIMSQYDLINSLKVRPDKAKEFIDKTINNEYLIKIKNHNFDTQKSVYRVNKFVEEEINIYEEKNKIFSDILDRISIINAEVIQKTNYLEMLSSIDNIQNIELKDMLRRDLQENLIAYLTGANKTCLILSGSMIENILLDKVIEKQITKYEIKNKNVLVNKMDLSELIYVAEKEKLIDKIPLDLANAIRGFRNFIHPGKEYRDKNNTINQTSAELAWSALKYIILGHL